jgi:hypothetical protein
MSAYSDLGLGPHKSIKPITGTVDCCARATTGHAAALPSPAMNSLRRILDPSPWIRRAYRSDGCKGTMVLPGADVRCTA